jgi:hypothetical protein
LNREPIVGLAFNETPPVAPATPALPKTDLPKQAQRAKLFQHVVHVLDQLGAVPNQPVAAARRAAVHATRHSKHLAPLLHGVPGGDQRPGSLGRFDHDHPQAHARDDPVSLRERAPQGRRTRKRFAGDRAALDDFGSQLVVLRRIDVEHAAAQDGDCSPAGRQRTAMGRRIDAAGHAADDRKPGPGQAGSQPLSLGQTVLRGVPRPDDGDGRGIRRQDRAADE